MGSHVVVFCCCCFIDYFILLSPSPSLLIGCTVSLLQQLPQEFVGSDWQMESLMYAKSIHFRNSIGLNSGLIQWGDFLFVIFLFYFNGWIL